MRTGKVKWYNGKKCFGFITPDAANEEGNTEDVFVHSSVLKASDVRFLNEGDVVEFKEEVRNGKLSVTEIKLIQRDEESAKRFQERRSQYLGGHDDHGGRGERSERTGRSSSNREENTGERRSGFAFWKK